MRFSPAAGPSKRDQTETGGVCKERKSAQDQGTSFPSKVWSAALEHTLSFVNDSFNRFTVHGQMTLHSLCLDSSAHVSVAEGLSPTLRTRDALSLQNAAFEYVDEPVVMQKCS